jgi:hypothetical protein
VFAVIGIMMVPLLLLDELSVGLSIAMVVVVVEVGDLVVDLLEVVDADSSVIRLWRRLLR